jgi:hypothetical protein
VLAGDVLPGGVELVDGVVAAAGLECLAHALVQGQEVEAGGGPAAGDGLPRLDGGQVQGVTRAQGQGLAGYRFESYRGSFLIWPLVSWNARRWITRV